MTKMRRILRVLMIVFAWMAALFAAIQIIPYGRTHENPPTLAEPDWDSPRTRELAKRACFDCHSNETHWPWYANVAPMSWMVQLDVDNARETVNFSEWNRPYDLAHYAGDRIRSGMMPPMKYELAHPEAQLTDQERFELARGLDATLRRTEAHR